MTQLIIYSGSAGTGKTNALLDQYCEGLNSAKAEGRIGSTLWLSPTQRVQKRISHQVISRFGSTCFSPNVLTFDLFAKKILEAQGGPHSPISPVKKRLLIRRIAGSLHEQGELRYFQPIAETTGFLDIVSNFISELKREEIWPETFEKACQHRPTNFARRNEEIGRIYTLYQQHLTEQNWYDNEGRFWLARNALADRQHGPFANLRLLIVDGFTDFTQTQHEILRLLSDWIEETAISLPLDHHQLRTDLFAKPHSALERLARDLPEKIVFRHQRFPLAADRATPASSKPNRSRQRDDDPTRSLFSVLDKDADSRAKAIQVISERLFSNPRLVTPEVDANGLEIIAASGTMSEWEAVASRMKALLGDNGLTLRSVPDLAETSPVMPQDIVIGIRTVSEDGPRLRDFLVSAGLPAWCEAQIPLTSSPIVRAISSLLQLELEDWTYDRLLSVLDSNFFQPDWPEFRAAQGARSVAAILRQVQVSVGREMILRVVGRAATEKSSEPTTGQKTLAENARRALPLLTRLSRSLERLRRSHTLADWTDVLATIGDELGWSGRSKLTNDRLAESESREWDLFQRILRTAAEADQRLNTEGQVPSFDLAEFFAEMTDLLGHETMKPEPERGGCVRILGMEQIRHLDVPYLFLVGLNESSFPMNRSDDCLFSESERQEFITQGLPLRHQSSHQADEMLLFYSVVTQARHRLTLSYPAVDSKGQPVYPSPYLSALMSLFAADVVKVSTEGQLNPVPEAERALTKTDLRLAAMSEARAGRLGLLRATWELEPLTKSVWNTLSACDVNDHRFHQRGFTQYEGRLDLPQNLSRLRQKFGPYYQFSATELEAYAACPFRYWISNVLKIDPIRSPEETTDHAARGTLLHEVLATLLREGIPADPEALQHRFQELVNFQLDRTIVDSDLQGGLVEIERRILLQWSVAFAEQHKSYQEWSGSQFEQVQSLAPEIPFGELSDPSRSPQNLHPEIRFGDESAGVKLRGRIDRVDHGTVGGKPAYLVIDYKSGKPPVMKHDAIVEGRSLQLPLYLLAVRRLGLVSPDATPLHMGYWLLKQTGFRAEALGAKKRSLDAAGVARIETILDDLLPKLAEEIRSGRFVVENSDPNCTGSCPYRTTCRVNQLRPIAALLGKQSPPRIDPTSVAEADVKEFPE